MFRPEAVTLTTTSALNFIDLAFMDRASIYTHKAWISRNLLSWLFKARCLVLVSGCFDDILVVDTLLEAANKPLNLLEVYPKDFR